MAGLKFTVKVKAFTLVETLISLVIILSVFAIGTMIMVNVLKSDRHQERLQAAIMLNLVQARTLSERSYIDQSFSQDGLQIIKQVSPYPENENLLEMTFLIKDHNNKLIMQRKQILIKAGTGLEYE